MDTTPSEETTTVLIATRTEMDTMDLPMATTRPQLAPTEKEVAKIISPCEKGRGQTVCYM